MAIQLGLQSKGQVSQYELDKLRPSTDIAIAIDRLSEGAVPVRDLRPDLHDVVVLRPAVAVAAEARP